MAQHLDNLLKVILLVVLLVLPLESSAEDSTSLVAKYAALIADQKRDDAEALSRKVIPTSFTEAPSDARYIDGLRLLTDVLIRKGQLLEAKAELALWQKELERNDLGEELVAAAVLLNLARVHLALDSFEEAEFFVRKSIRICKRHSFENNELTPFLMQTLGMALYGRGQLGVSAALLERSYDLLQNKRDLEPLAQASVLRDLGAVYLASDDKRSGEQYLLSAYTTLKETYGDTHPDLAQTERLLGLVYLSLEELGKSEQYLESSLKRAHSIDTPKETPLVGDILLNQAELNIARKQFGPALGLAAMGGANVQKAVAANNWRNVKTMVLNGIIYFETNFVGRSMHFAKQANDGLVQVPYILHPEVAYVCRQLFSLNEKLGISAPGIIFERIVAERNDELGTVAYICFIIDIVFFILLIVELFIFRKEAPSQISTALVCGAAAVALNMILVWLAPNLAEQQKLLWGSTAAWNIGSLAKVALCVVCGILFAKKMQYPPMVFSEDESSNKTSLLQVDFLKWLIASLVVCIGFSILIFGLAPVRFTPQYQLVSDFQFAQWGLAHRVSLLNIFIAFYYAFFEEVSFRLALQSYLAYRLSWQQNRFWLAVGLSSLIWASNHVGVLEPDWVKFVQLLPLGICCGYMLRHYGLWAAVILHGLFNVSSSYLDPLFLELAM